MTLVALVEAYLAARQLVPHGRHACMLRSLARRLPGGTEAIPAPAALAQWLRDLRRGGASPATCLCYRRMLLALYRWGAARGRCRPLVPDDLPREKPPRRMPEAWTCDEVQRLVNAAGSLEGYCGWCELPRRLYWTTLLLGCWYTAARLGSLLAVRWEDLDLDRGWLQLPAEVEKTRTARLFALPPSFSRQLRGLPRVDCHVWPAPRQHRHLYRTLRRLCIAAAIRCPPGRFQCFHRLRRSAISAAAAIDLEVARRLAGHSSSQITLRHYVDPRIACPPRIVVPEIEPPAPLRVLG